jgi:hypothetical protein
MSLRCHAWSRVLSLLALIATTTAAAQSTYRITELFSNQDGSIQFIRLSGTGLDQPDGFRGLVISVTYRGSLRQWTFPSLPNLPTTQRDIVVGVAPTIPVPDVGDVPTIFQFTSCCVAVAHPDYVIPQNFLPTDGATVNFASIDQITYSTLPTDGASALFPDLSVGVAQLPGIGCIGFKPGTCGTAVHPTPTLINAVEYYNAAQDHYFMTASAPDIEALDSGRFTGWRRTGESFQVGAHPSTTLGLEYTYYGDPVCRFYIPPAEGDSHFFSASSDECATVQTRFPEFILESSAAFYAMLPNDLSTGECGVMSGFIDGDIQLRPVFRLWDGRADTNHRYTTRLDLHDAMIDQGWISEGYGPLGVAFCVM